MKNWVIKLLLSSSMCVVGVAAVLIGIFYFKFISERIYEDSTLHLKEIYSQVNHSFGAFVERNWGLLDSWGDHLSLADNNENKEIYDFIEKEQEYWGFSEFYFLSSNKTCITYDGSEANIDLENVWNSFSNEDAPIMAGAKLSTGHEVTVFAVPVKNGRYKNFNFDAIAISYTNADLASSLDVNAFEGEAKCFVIDKDGNVLLSTQKGGSIFNNYLVYLSAVSDLSNEKIEQMKNDWTTLCLA